jgi:hypothetical protein
VLQVEKIQPKSSVPAFLEICDIAGLVKGAAEVRRGRVGLRAGSTSRSAGCSRLMQAGLWPPLVPLQTHNPFLPPASRARWQRSSSQLGPATSATTPRTASCQLPVLPAGRGPRQRLPLPHLGRGRHLPRLPRL